MTGFILTKNSDLLISDGSVISTEYHVFLYLENIKILLKMTGVPYYKNGVEYVRINDVKLQIKPGKLRVRFENLFNGQKELERIGNEVVNQNIKLLESSFVPVVERAMERKIFEVTNQIFERAPADDFFP